jgi:EmrB/QacA subfamily drug resistance transporter
VRARPSAAVVTALAAGGTFLALLDATVANLAVPAIAKEFPAPVPAQTLSNVSWVITLYATVFAALLAPVGRLDTVLGRRGLFVGGVTVFTLASLACSLSTNLPMLIASRGLQAVGAAAMVPASLAIVLTDTPADQRTKAIGVWSAAGALAAAIGPSLGGVLVEWFSWRALFAINLPFGIVIVAAACRLVPEGLRSGRMPDLLGTALVASGVGATVLGMSRGQEWGWTDVKTLTCLAGGPLLVVLALKRSATHPVPAVETTLWRSRTFLLTNIASFAYGAALFVWLLLGMLVLIQQWAYSPLRAGLAMTPGALAAGATAVLISRTGGRLGPKLVSQIGNLTIFAVGVFAAATLPSQSDFLGYWLPLSLVIGFGIGLISWSLSASAVLSVSPLKFGAATGLNIACRQVGGALGVAALTVILFHAPGRNGFAAAYLACAICALVAAVASCGFTDLQADRYRGRHRSRGASPAHASHRVLSPPITSPIGPQLTTALPIHEIGLPRATTRQPVFAERNAS